jgi:hypothetical protein
MNNVIRFRPADSPRRTASGDRGAQILFFTGVRYQHMSDDARPPAPQPPRARRKRQGGEIGGQKADARVDARRGRVQSIPFPR